MKKWIVMALCLALLFTLAACADSGVETRSNTGAAAETNAKPGINASTNGDTNVVDGEMPTVRNQTEYILYQNIFFNEMADDYLGQTTVKEGTLTRIYDAFNDRTRYYVWGYMDATKCCDWQWEFVPKDPDSLPANGSLVKLTGTLTKDDNALDKIWITDGEIELERAFQPEDCDVDMTTMNATLERVQLLNVQYKPESFEGKTLRVYGRVLNPTTIQHPYYDNAWTQPFAAQEEVPAIGTMVILTGTWKGDTVQADRVETTKAY